MIRVFRPGRRIIATVAILAALLVLTAAVTAAATYLIEKNYPAQGRFIDVAGTRVHVVELERQSATRDLPTVVLIHGSGVNLEDMRMLGERLSERYRVVLIDRPGHGWSEPLPGPTRESPSSQAAMLHEALDQLGVTSSILVGHSWGGALALAYALDHPERLKALVLLAPVAHSWRPRGITWAYEFGAIPLLGSLLARTFALPVGALVTNLAVAATFSPQAAPVDYVHRSALLLGLRPREFLANAEEFEGLKTFVRAHGLRYGNISVPTVIITGNRDNSLNFRLHAGALVAVIPKSKLILLPDVGHMPHYVAPDHVVGAIAEAAQGDIECTDSYSPRLVIACNQ